MKYRSTRGKESGLSFEDVLLAGYASDNGMYIPEVIPSLSQKELSEWASLTYPELVYEITRKFISPEELGNEDLRRTIESSFSRFSHPDVINIKNLPQVSIMELFHGPTLAFKDIALAVVGGLLNTFMARKNRSIIALVGTSGDTGSAAIEGIRGLKNVDIVVLYPKGRVTRVQELQMTTVRDSNVHVYAVDGTSDDLDVPIKQCFADRNFVSKYNLISLNSLNWTRILAQIPMYFFAYYKISTECGQKVEIVVPTGAAGNITAGCIAHKMGLPIQLVATVNENDIVARTMQRGNFSTADSVKATFSSAMDIQIPYNIERLLFLFSGYNELKVKSWMDEFDTKEHTQLPDDIVAEMKDVITDSYVSSDSMVVDTIKRVYEEFNYILCPHTAVAVSFHYHKAPTMKRVVMATASPSKFPAAIKAAGKTPPTTGIEHLSENSAKDILVLKKEEDWFIFLKNEILRISEMRSPNLNN